MSDLQFIPVNVPSYNIYLKTIDTTLVSDTICAKVISAVTDPPTSQNFIFLFPNPATNFCNINFTSAPQTATTIKLLTITGTTLIKTKATFPKTELNIASLNAGVYLVVIESAEERRVFKLVKE